MNTGLGRRTQYANHGSWKNSAERKYSKRTLPAELKIICVVQRAKLPKDICESLPQQPSGEQRMNGKNVLRNVYPVTNLRNED
jgi:hypothetical protein